MPSSKSSHEHWLIEVFCRVAHFVEFFFLLLNSYFDSVFKEKKKKKAYVIRLSFSLVSSFVCESPFPLLII